MGDIKPVREKDVKWLRHIAGPRGGMYPGEHYDFIPDSVRVRLERHGFIEIYVPNNLAHKDRLVLTPCGQRFLDERDAQKRDTAAFAAVRGSK